MTATSTDACTSCGRSLRHCHGTWITHRDAGECTDPTCVEPAEAHELEVVCQELDERCSCD